MVSYLAFLVAMLETLSNVIIVDINGNIQSIQNVGMWNYGVN